MTRREQASDPNADLLVVARSQEDLEPMSTITLPASDPRGAKAVDIAVDAGQWLKCRTVRGNRCYGIRSSRNPNQVYLVTRLSCTCYDAQRHECKHMLAVRLHCEAVAEGLVAA